MRSVEARFASAPLIVAGMGGLSLGLATPPFDLWVLVLPALALLRLAVALATSAASVARSAFVWALTAGLVGLRFVPAVVERFSALGAFVGVAAWLTLASAQAVPWAIGGVCGRILERRCSCPAPAAFGVGVYLACSLPAVFPWTPAGLMSPWPASIQLAELVGERGVSFLLAVAMACCAELLIRRRRWWLPAVVGFAVLGGVWLYGSWRLARLAREPHSAILRVGLVQPALPARLRRSERNKQRDLRTLQRLTRLAVARGAELSVWPEASYPYRLLHEPAERPQTHRHILEPGTLGPLLFGAVTESEQAVYNSVLTLDRNGVLSKPQDKLRPLWFGEAVPLADVFPDLARLAPRAIRAGQTVTLQQIGRARIGAVNCYEDTLPDTARRIALAQPNLLVGVTNDAWFAGSWAAELHLRLAIPRAVEARLDLVRAVNGADSNWVDASGRIRARGRVGSEDVLIATPTLRDHPPTWFVRFGNAPAWLGITALVLFFCIRARLNASSARAGRHLPDDRDRLKPRLNT